MRQAYPVWNAWGKDVYIAAAAIGWKKVQRLHDSSDGRDDLDPVCFHFCNVFAHAIVTCLVYFLAVRLCTIRDALAAAAKASMPAAQEQQPLQQQPEGSPVDSMDRWVPAAVLGTYAGRVHNLLTLQFLCWVI